MERCIYLDKVYALSERLGLSKKDMPNTCHGKWFYCPNLPAYKSIQEVRPVVLETKK